VLSHRPVALRQVIVTANHVLQPWNGLFHGKQHSVQMQKNTPDSCEPGYESTNKVVEEEPGSPVDSCWADRLWR